MKLYPISNSMIDVFIGDGWYNWSRWRKMKGGWFQVSGPTVEQPALVLKSLIGE